MRTDGSSRVEQLELARPRLIGLAYRMLGSVAEAEDVVQDVAARYLGLDAAIRSPEQYLKSMTARASLDVLRSARFRREAYVGPWLPEPISSEAAPGPDPEEWIEREDSISFAFLVILQTLSPLERAAFLLHDVFDYEYAEIGDTLGRSEAACRQLVSRAREHLRQRRPRFDARPSEKRRLIESFLSAAREGDLEGLISVLSRDAVLWVDGGGKVAAATRPVAGADRVARVMTNVFRKTPDLQARIEQANGEPALILYGRAGVTSVVSFDTSAGSIVAIYIQRNPDKLARFGGLKNCEPIL